MRWGGGRIEGEEGGERKRQSGCNISEKNKREKQREYQNTPQSLKWIHFVNKISQQEKQPNGFSGNFYQAFEEEIMAVMPALCSSFCSSVSFFSRKEAPRINALFKELACVLQAASVWSGKEV